MLIIKKRLDLLPNNQKKSEGMNKIGILALLVFFNQAFSQTFQGEKCGFDAVMSRLDKKYPDLKKNRDAFSERMADSNMKKLLLSKYGESTYANALYTGQVYEIPVVVHVIESSATSNSNLSVTDTEITNWIDRANSMYATTYGNGFYTEGPGPTGGSVMPFRLVLAKRAPNCETTSGIVRYNGSTIPGYDDYGVSMQTSNGADDYLIKTQVAPHWPENSYFNIYVVIGFDGQQQLTYGLMGYAAFPNSYDFDYESFMKVATIKNTNDTTLTHELGHAFGLYHTFQGIGYTIQNACPPNGNCATTGDGVCDTSPSRSMYGVTVPNNNAIDPCTNVNYDGTQYNIMNYTSVERKFTDGQRDRAILSMMEYRKNLINSTAAKDLSAIPPSTVSVIPAVCNPPTTLHPTNNNFAIGPTKVNFGSISSTTNGYDSDEIAPVFFADFTAASCIRPAYSTDIAVGTATPLEVTYLNGFSIPNKFRTKVWIDYNNNGSFEASELVINHISPANVASNSYPIITGNVTAPANAVKNTYLRMRVAVDAATFQTTTALPDFDACSPLQYGQMEDYAVRILDVLGTSDVKDNVDTKLVYLKNENKLKLMGSNNAYFGEYQIYDMSGKLFQKGNTKTNEIQITNELLKGSYIINYSNDKIKESKKFLNN